MRMLSLFSIYPIIPLTLNFFENTFFGISFNLNLSYLADHTPNEQFFFPVHLLYCQTFFFIYACNGKQEKCNKFSIKKVVKKNIKLRNAWITNVAEKGGKN